MRLTHILLVGLLTFAPLLLGTTPAKADQLDVAQDCFENNGGPQSCPNVLGWCSALWGIDRREACRETMYLEWDRVLNAEWQKLKSIAQGRNLTDWTDGVTPIWDRMLAEQRVWITWRDASCAWQMPVPEGEVRSATEARYDCLMQMTRARSQQLWDMSYYLQTAGLG